MNKIKIGILAFFLFNSIAVISFAQIEFTEIKDGKGWKELIKKSESSGIPVFLDIYATWCGPCKYLDREVYTDSTVAEVYNKLFLNARIDGESEFGRQLVQRYELHAYPTMYFIDSNEKILSSIVGVREAGPLAETGKVISENIQKIAEYEKKFATNSLSPEELIKYQSILVSIGQTEKASTLASSILQSLSDDKILEPEFTSIIYSSTTDLDGRIFSIFKDDRAKAFEVWGKDTAEQVLNNIYNASIGKAIEKKDTVYLKRVITELLPVYAADNEADLDYLRNITHKIYYANTDNWELYKRMIMNNYQKNPLDKGVYLYQEAYELIKEYPGNPQALDVSATFINEALSADRNVENLLMTAYIEGMRNNFDLAVGYLEEAESMGLSAQQKSMHDELKKIIEQVRLKK